MNNKDKAILQNLLIMYNDFYSSKELFNKSYFKYSPEDVENVITLVTNETNLAQKKKQSKIRESINSIKTEDEVKDFYLENLRYNRNDIDSKEKNLQGISLEELKHLYSILYTSPLRINIRKSDLLDLIDKYFESIDRAHSMKP